MIVDAFTDKPFPGNPAAVCAMGGWPSEEGSIFDIMKKDDLVLSDMNYGTDWCGG